MSKFIKMFTILFLLCSKVFCQESFWTVHNIDSLGLLRNIKVTNNGIYLRTDNGLFKSIDNGITFKQLINNTVKCFDIDKDGILITSEITDNYTSEIIIRGVTSDSLSILNRYLIGQSHFELGYANIIKNFEHNIYSAIVQPSPKMYWAYVITFDSSTNSWSKFYESNDVHNSSASIAGIYPVSSDTIFVSEFYKIQTVKVTFDQGKNWRTVGGYDNEHGFTS